MPATKRPSTSCLNPLQEFGERELISEEQKARYIRLNPLQEFGEREQNRAFAGRNTRVLIPFRNSGRENGIFPQRLAGCLS